MKRFSHIVIASDLDGTLLAKNEAGDARNLDRIRYFIENGGHFTVASGRGPCQIEGRIPYPLSLCNLPVVTANGACLYDFSAARPICEYPMSHETIVRLYEYLKQYFPSVGIRASAATCMYAEDDRNPYIRRDCETLKKILRFMPVSEWASGHVYKIAARGDADTIAAAWSALEQEFGNELELATSGAMTLDIQCKGRTKAKMLQEAVADYLPYPTVLCTVGDYENDAEMHSLSDLPCCPENATDHIKSICRLHLCHHSKGVIGDLIDYLDSHDVSQLATKKGYENA